ncbi:hypothetical protein K5549_021550, partial [Capra hircus]
KFGRFCFWNFDNWLLLHGFCKAMCNHQACLLHLVSFTCSVLYKDKFTQQ